MNANWSLHLGDCIEGMRGLADKSACLEWNGARNARGYGTRRYLGKSCLAHRVAWILAHGDIPEGMCVLHRCDNPPCCNPEHLFLGTQADNIADMHAKGRARKAVGDQHPRRLHPEKWARERNHTHLHPETVRGEKNPRAKLTRAKVEELRSRHACGESLRELARQLQMDRSTISDAVKGVTWK